MRVLTNVLGSTLLIGAISIVSADDTSKYKQYSSGRTMSGSTTTVTTKNPAADPIQITKPNCSSTGTTSDMAVEGRRAFMRLNCYSCHGMGGHGAGMGPSLVGEANEMDAVNSGEEGGMPSFKKNLCANDIKNLSAYIALLGTGTEPTFTHWWEKGKPSK